MDYVKKILAERTSLDGTVLIGIGVVCLLFSPLVKWAAWGRNSLWCMDTSY